MSSKQNEYLFSLKFSTLAILISCLPLFGFLACVFLSLYLHFKGSTATHCNVPNYLPSISAAIGGYTPERYVWRIAIALHCWPRIFLPPVMYYYHYMSFIGSIGPKSLYKFMVVLSSVLHMLENSSLVGLTYISSLENRNLHENLFVSFMVTSEVYMVLTCIIFKWSRSGVPMNSKDSKSFKLKVFFFIFNLASFFLALYFYFRHNAYCEPGVYTLFGLMEYFTVSSNIAFHSTIGFDFNDKEIAVIPIQNSKDTSKKQ